MMCGVHSPTAAIPGPRHHFDLVYDGQAAAAIQAGHTALHPELKRRHFMGRELKRSVYRRLLDLPEV
jgi:hypothetical protein